MVTGANRGIGFEVCRQLANRGFAVLLTARDAQKAQSAAKRLASIGQVEPLALDVGDGSSIDNSANEVANRYGHLDALVNNAGINYDTWEKTENADINGAVMQTITTNLLGPWPNVLCIRTDNAAMQTRTLILEQAGYAITQARDLRQVSGRDPECLVQAVDTLLKNPRRAEARPAS